MDRDELLTRVRDKEGLLCSITDRIDEDLLQHAANLKMIANYGVGYDNIQLQAATNRKDSCFQHAGGTYGCDSGSRFCPHPGGCQTTGGRRQNAPGAASSSSGPLAVSWKDVSGKTLGIVGMGQIGRAMARRAKGFDMRVVYHSRTRLETLGGTAIVRGNM